MADLSTNFLGIKSPNPFWLASAPPTDKAYNVERAYEAGWGGVVWKTLGEAGPQHMHLRLADLLHPAPGVIVTTEEIARGAPAGLGGPGGARARGHAMTPPPSKTRNFWGVGPPPAEEEAQLLGGQTPR